MTLEFTIGQPWLVMVTGEPGSGKTTLGRRLATELRLPYLSRDDVRGGLLATAGLWTNQMRTASARGIAVEAFVQLVETSAKLGVSAVLEFVVFGNRADTFDRIKAAGHVLVVHAVCQDASNRAAARDLADPLLNRPRVLDALGYESVEAYLRATTDRRDEVRDGIRIDLGLPVIQVRTDDGYDPPIEDIVDWIVTHTRR